MAGPIIAKVLKGNVLAIALLLLAYFIVQGIRCSFAVKDSTNRLKSYEAQTARLTYGDMTYVDKGRAEAILSVHGIYGGYDQAFDTLKDKTDQYGVIAPSRFGYLGSEVQAVALLSNRQKRMPDCLTLSESKRPMCSRPPREERWQFALRSTIPNAPKGSSSTARLPLS